MQDEAQSFFTRIYNSFNSSKSSMAPNEYSAIDLESLNDGEDKSLMGSVKTRITEKSTYLKDSAT
eukprot:NODE_4233_length_683_cov_144.940063_g3600_i0.p1 GENE.NODE_4233_length_683_cov_144.940063_g3600_i0~~NODE_4233_length_683_cov_144.940063_g3600_i0.p1  ORF type:complete len:65 (+),score=0.71 NODE_4233_length_683_cov_144.940063_g3600_i0:3-197(+)